MLKISLVTKKYLGFTVLTCLTSKCPHVAKEETSLDWETKQIKQTGTVDRDVVSPNPDSDRKYWYATQITSVLGFSFIGTA
ncbi:hypothetical protein CDAR_306501 [Caerostris darwini]|uniref:Uncharacterized protein n=1 Tax=Caerostris darwini TaxID=1538125 RepID=A0AAV4SVL8_9ARAC|nr:hypothetical protein CDAR_306501 [Caerostris darwini]